MSRKGGELFEKQQIIGEILIADNDGIDGSQSIAVGFGARVIAVAQRGYGAALLGDIEAARGEYVIMADADGSYDFENLSPLIEKLRAGTDFVIGNRFARGIAPGAMPRCVGISAIRLSASSVGCFQSFRSETFAAVLKDSEPPLFASSVSRQQGWNLQLK